MTTLEPLATLYEREPAPAGTLPPALAALYDGGLAIPEGTGARPYVVANFVETIDGVVSYDDAPGKNGGGPISGESKPDHAVMGLLRALADAVIVGAGSLNAEAGHLHTPAFIYPPLAAEYATWRERLGRGARPPLTVVVSASGRVNLDEATFHQPFIPPLLAREGSGVGFALIATTRAGAALLAAHGLPAGVEAFAVGEDDAGGVAPGALLEVLAREHGVRVALHEGGPRLFAAFLAAGCVDELFLTFAPQFAGRARGSRRPALVEGRAFAPEGAPWAALLSVKRAGGHLFLRYRLGAGDGA